MQFNCTIELPGVKDHSYIIDASDGEAAFQRALEDSIEMFGPSGRVKTLHEADVCDVENSRLADEATQMFQRDIAMLSTMVENKGFSNPDVNILFYPDRVIFRVSVENSGNGKVQRPLREFGSRTSWAWYRGRTYDEALATATQAVALMEEDVGLACAKWFE